MVFDCVMPWVGGVVVGGGLACFWWGVNEGVAHDA